MEGDWTLKNYKSRFSYLSSQLFEESESRNQEVSRMKSNIIMFIDLLVIGLKGCMKDVQEMMKMMITFPLSQKRKKKENKDPIRGKTKALTI